MKFYKMPRRGCLLSASNPAREITHCSPVKAFCFTGFTVLRRWRNSAASPKVHWAQRQAQGTAVINCCCGQQLCSCKLPSMIGTTRRLDHSRSSAREPTLDSSRVCICSASGCGKWQHRNEAGCCAQLCLAGPDLLRWVLCAI